MMGDVSTPLEHLRRAAKRFMDAATFCVMVLFIMVAAVIAAFALFTLAALRVIGQTANIWVPGIIVLAMIWVLSN